MSYTESSFKRLPFNEDLVEKISIKNRLTLVSILEETPEISKTVGCFDMFFWKDPHQEAYIDRIIKFRALRMRRAKKIQASQEKLKTTIINIDQERKKTLDNILSLKEKEKNQKELSKALNKVPPGSGRFRFSFTENKWIKD